MKVIYGIELIILVGWLGCVSASRDNTDRNTDFTDSKIDDDNIEANNDRNVTSMEATEDEREKCERIANAARTGLDNLAARFVTGNSSDPTVFQLRRNFKKLALSAANDAVTELSVTRNSSGIETSNASFVTALPNDYWQTYVDTLNDEFVNSTDSQNHHRLNFSDPSTREMADEFRDFAASLYLDAHECDGRFASAFSSESTQKLNAPTCWSEEEDKILAEDRRRRLAAHASRRKTKDEDILYSTAFLKRVETVLNAESASEIRLEPGQRKFSWLSYVESLSENIPLEVRQEGFALVRDLYLELQELKNHFPEWDGYNFDRIVDDLTARQFFSVDFGAGTFSKDIVKYGDVFELDYMELEERESGADPDKLVFGVFNYVGDKRENLGVKQLRRILDALVTFHFKIQDPSPICKGDASTTTPVPVCTLDSSSLCSNEETTADPAPESPKPKCWTVQRDPELLPERHERMNAYVMWKEADAQNKFWGGKYLIAVEEALNAKSAEEISRDDNLLKLIPELAFIKTSSMNSSLTLWKETLEYYRDLSLAFGEMQDRTPDWQGFEFKNIMKNVTEGVKIVRDKYADKSGSATPEIIFDTYNVLGKPFNLRYEAIGNSDSTDKTDQLVIGKFIYDGEESEKLGARYFRRILNGGVRLYFKVRHPSMAPVCGSGAETEAHPLE